MKVNSKSQADNNSQIEPQKPIETTSAPIMPNPMLSAGFLVEYSFKGNERWLQYFNYGMPVVTNNIDNAKRFLSKKSAENALKKAILANINWFDFGKIIPIG